MVRLAYIVLVALGFSAVAAGAQTPIVGQEGRVVILDASGSMKRHSFRRGAPDRWAQALLGLEEILEQLQDRGDSVPTTFMTFGDKFRWADVQNNYASSYDYPPSGPLCSDVTVRTQFAPIDTGTIRRIVGIARDEEPSGMTPLPLALNLALQLLDPDHGGEIVLVSDMEEPNCLIESQTLCGAIESELQKFRDANSLKVYFRVLATPNSGFAEAIEDCVTSTTEDLDESAPDPEESVKELLGTVPVDVRLVARGGGNLDAGNIDPRGFVVAAIDPRTGQSVSSGPPGRLQVPPGTYIFRASYAGKTWETEATLTRAGTVNIEVDGGRLEISAVDAQGQPIARLDNIAIIHEATNAQVWTNTGFNLPSTVDLGTGTYRVVGSVTGKPRSEILVPLAPASRGEAILRFDGPLSLNEVAINVAVSQPTLLPNPNAPYRPDVSLIAETGAITRLSPGVTALQLDSGAYEIRVAAEPPHVMAFDVGAIEGLQNVDVHVRPGWFSVDIAQGNEGALELLAADGTPLFSFKGSKVQHSLPDGEYSLVFRHSDGRTSPPKTLTIVTGEMTEIDF